MTFDAPPWHLCLDTETIRKNRWARVPGSRWIGFSPPDPNANRRPQKSMIRSRSQTYAPPNCILYLLDAPVLPLLTDAVHITDALRRAAMSRLSNWARRHTDEAVEFQRPDAPDQFSSPILSGRSLDGTLLQGHSHAYYLALPQTEDRRRIGAVAVFARAAFGTAESDALQSIRFLRLFTDRNAELRCQMVALGQASLLPEDLAGTSDVWTSMTPFLGSSQIGRLHQVRYLRKGLRREWRRVAETNPAWSNVELLDVEPIPVEESQRSQQPLARDFHRIRSKDGGRNDWRPAEHFQLRFSAPITGPLALGYAAHFGMGLFRPR
jgi:CRISPR-associated protein Csb2